MDIAFNTATALPNGMDTASNTETYKTINFPLKTEFYNPRFITQGQCSILQMNYVLVSLQTTKAQNSIDQNSIDSLQPLLLAII